MVEFSFIFGLKILFVVIALAKGQEDAYQSRTIPNEIAPYTSHWNAAFTSDQEKDPSNPQNPETDDEIALSQSSKSKSSKNDTGDSPTSRRITVSNIKLISRTSPTTIATSKLTQVFFDTASKPSEFLNVNVSSISPEGGRTGTPNRTPRTTSRNTSKLDQSTKTPRRIENPTMKISRKTSKPTTTEQTSTPKIGSEMEPTQKVTWTTIDPILKRIPTTESVAQDYVYEDPNVSSARMEGLGAKSTTTEYLTMQNTKNTTWNFVRPQNAGYPVTKSERRPETTRLSTRYPVAGPDDEAQLEFRQSFKGTKYPVSEFEPEFVRQSQSTRHPVSERNRGMQPEVIRQSQSAKYPVSERSRGMKPEVIRQYPVSTSEGEMQPEFMRHSRRRHPVPASKVGMQPEVVQQPSTRHPVFESEEEMQTENIRQFQRGNYPTSELNKGMEPEFIRQPQNKKYPVYSSEAGAQPESIKQSPDTRYLVSASDGGKQPEFIGQSQSTPVFVSERGMQPKFLQQSRSTGYPILVPESTVLSETIRPAQGVGYPISVSEDGIQPEVMRSTQRYSVAMPDGQRQPEFTQSKQGVIDSVPRTRIEKQPEFVLRTQDTRYASDIGMQQGVRHSTDNIRYPVAISGSEQPEIRSTQSTKYPATVLEDGIQPAFMRTTQYTPNRIQPESRQPNQRARLPVSNPEYGRQPELIQQPQGLSYRVPVSEDIMQPGFLQPTQRVMYSVPTEVQSELQPTLKPVSKIVFRGQPSTQNNPFSSTGQNILQNMQEFSTDRRMASTPLMFSESSTYPFSGPSVYTSTPIAHFQNVTEATKPVVRTGVAYPVDYAADYHTSEPRSPKRSENYPVGKPEDYEESYDDGDYRPDYPEHKSAEYLSYYSDAESGSYPGERPVEYSKSNPGDEQDPDSLNGRSRVAYEDKVNGENPVEYQDDFVEKDGYYIEDPPPDESDYPDNERITPGRLRNSKYDPPVFRTPNRQNHPQVGDNLGSLYYPDGKPRTSTYPAVHSDMKVNGQFNVVNQAEDRTSSYYPADRVTYPAERITYPAERVADKVTYPTERVAYPVDRVTYPATRLEMKSTHSLNVKSKTETEITEGSKGPSSDPQVKGHEDPENTDNPEDLVDPADLHQRTLKTPETTAPPEDNIKTRVDKTEKPASNRPFTPLRRNWKDSEFMSSAVTHKWSKTPMYGSSTTPSNCSSPIYWSSEQRRAGSTDSVALPPNCVPGKRGGGAPDGRGGQGRHESEKSRFWNVSSIPVPPAKPTVPAELLDSRSIFSQESPEDTHFIDDLIEAQQEYRRLHQVVEFDVKTELRSLARRKAEIQSTNTWLCSHKDFGCSAFSHSLDASITPVDIATEWYAESEGYDYSTEPDLQRRPYVGLFTQMVWRSTMEVGCGRFEVEDENIMTVVCLYSPPGNEPGKFLDNVLPIPPLDESGRLQMADGSDGLVIANLFSVVASLLAVTLSWNLLKISA